MNTGLIAFAVGLIASLGLTIPVRQLALRVGMVDLPGPRKVHLQPIPLLGGLAIYGAFVVALLLFPHWPLHILELGAILTGATWLGSAGTQRKVPLSRSAYVAIHLQVPSSKRSR